MTGFKDYLAFSNYKFDETKGQIILVKNGLVAQSIIKLVGAQNEYLGEYLLMSEDAPDGNLILGAT